MMTTMAWQKSGQDITGWIDVSSRASQLGQSGRFLISNAAWMMAVYFVSDTADRNDPAREGWRLGRVLAELDIALSRRRGRTGKLPKEFNLFLPQSFDRLRGLTLPFAQLSVQVDQSPDLPVFRIDIAPCIARQPEPQVTQLAA